MATPAIGLEPTRDCVFVSTHFHMGIGKMKQIRNLQVITNADKSKLRHQKQLIDSPELAEITSQDGKLKRYLDSKTCRYSESVGFLNKAWLPEVDRVMLAYQNVRRPALVAKFMAKYRDLELVDFEPLSRSSEEGGLGEHFHRGDYPPSYVVEQGFAFTFAYKPVGLTWPEWLSDIVVAREVEKESSIRQQAIEEWRDAMRLTTVTMVDALVDVLKPGTDGKRKKLYDTTVEKLQEYLESYHTRDLANDLGNDPEYRDSIEKLKSLMSGVSVHQLRESETLKDYVAGQLEVVRKELGTLVQVTGRKFR